MAAVFLLFRRKTTPFAKARNVFLFCQLGFRHARQSLARRFAARRRLAPPPPPARLRSCLPLILLRHNHARRVSRRRARPRRVLQPDVGLAQGTGTPQRRLSLPPFASSPSRRRPSCHRARTHPPLATLATKPRAHFQTSRKNASATAASRRRWTRGWACCSRGRRMRRG